MDKSGTQADSCPPFGQRNHHITMGSSMFSHDYHVLICIIIYSLQYLSDFFIVIPLQHLNLLDNFPMSPHGRSLGIQGTNHSQHTARNCQASLRHSFPRCSRILAAGGCNFPKNRWLMMVNLWLMMVHMRTTIIISFVIRIRSNKIGGC